MLPCAGLALDRRRKAQASQSIGLLAQRIDHDS